MNKKIAILIPTTSKKRNYKNFKDTDFYKFTLSSFLKTYDKEHNYTFFLGIDKDDTFFMNQEIQNSFIRMNKVLHNVNIKFITFNPSDGNVVWIWNELFKKAIAEDFDYYHQTGDDIEYLDKEWVNRCITEIDCMDGVGVCGHTDWGRKQICPEDKLLTQSFVGKSHWLIFGNYFHPYIRNWYCDDYITYLYDQATRARQIPHRIINRGGEPRYNVVECGEIAKKLVEKDLPKITWFLELKKRLNFYI